MGMHVYRSTEAPSTAPTTDDIGMHWIKTTNPIGHWFAMHTSSVSGWVDLMGGQSLPLAGGTMTGDIILKYDGNINSSALQDKSAVCKKFVVDSIAALPSPAPAKYWVADSVSPIAIGQALAPNSQGEGAISIGENATSEPGAIQYNGAIAIGFRAGAAGQAEQSILIGQNAGWTSGSELVGHASIFIGSYSGSGMPAYETNSRGVTCVGTRSGVNPRDGSTALGHLALGSYKAPGFNAIGIGPMANYLAGENSVAIGAGAACPDNYDTAYLMNNYPYAPTALWNQTKLSGANSVSLGFRAGAYISDDSIAIGSEALASSTKPTATNAFAIGAIVIGTRAAKTGAMRDGAIAIGTEAGVSNYGGTASDYFVGVKSIALGYQAGGRTGADAIAIGTQAGSGTSGANAIMIGKEAGAFAIRQTNSGPSQDSIAIGTQAGARLGTGSIAIGRAALGGATPSTAAKVIAIGDQAGQGGASAQPGAESIIIGARSAAGTSAGTRVIAIGSDAGMALGTESISIGFKAGGVSNASTLVAIGKYAGAGSAGTGQSGASSIMIGTGNGGGGTGQTGAIIIGNTSGNSSTAANTIVIGTNSAVQAGANAIVVGNGSLPTTGAVQGTDAVVVGYNSAIGTIGSNVVVIGSGTATNGAGNNAIVIGKGAGNGSAVGVDTILLGPGAGATSTSATAIAIGKDAGKKIGVNGIAIGTGASSTSTGNGTDCIAIGANTFSSAFVHTATSVVAIGPNALSAGGIVSGSGHIAIGLNALKSASTYAGSNANIGIGTGSGVYGGAVSGNGDNIAIGNSAMTGTGATGTMTGVTNIAIGTNAMRTVGATTSGTSNVVIGTNAMTYSGAAIINSTGVVAIGSGVASGTTFVPGNDSVLIGTDAGKRTAAGGVAVVAIGKSSGVLLGDNSVAIGNGAGKAADTHTGCVFLGAGATGSTANNQIQLGDTSHTVYAQAAVQTRSDARDKTDIRDTVLGLDFILGLRPVDWRWDRRIDYREYIEKDDGTITWVDHTPDGSKSGKRFHHGFIAQEVKSNCEEHGVDFGGYQDHKVNGGSDVLSLGYEEFIAPLVKSIQDQQAMINQQAMMIKDLQDAISKLLGK